MNPFAETKRLKDRFTIHKSKYFYLLVSLIVYFVSTAFLNATDNGFRLSVFFTTIVLLCFYIIAHSKYLVIGTMTLGLITLVSHWSILLYYPYPIFYLICYIGSIAFLTILTAAVLESVTKHTQITADTLFGAICGYFLLGFTWTYIYILIAWINPAAFSTHLLSVSIHDSVQHFLYYSFTTMTTLGYGDVLPISNIARTFSWLEAVAGQTYLAVWISQLVGLQIMQKNQPDNGNKS